MPAQARALYPRGIFAHAGQGGELAESLASIGGIVGEQAVHATEQGERLARVLPLTASVISEADAVEIAQPWPSKRMSAIAVVDEPQAQGQAVAAQRVESLDARDRLGSSGPKLRGRRLWSRITSR